MATSPWTRIAGTAATALLLVACAGGDDGDSATTTIVAAGPSSTEVNPLNPGPNTTTTSESTSTRPETTTTAPPAATVQAPDSEDPPLVEAEPDPEWWKPSGPLRTSDPAQLALDWGCAMQTRIEGENQAAFLDRLTGPGLTAPEVRDKLAWLGYPNAAPPIVAVRLESFNIAEPTNGTWRVSCRLGVPTIDEARTGTTIVGAGSVIPIHVELTEVDGGWIVSDFAIPSLDWGPPQHGGYR